jgi:hypothetical protein
MTEDKGSFEDTSNTAVQGGRTAVPVNLTGPDDSSSTQGTKNLCTVISCADQSLYYARDVWQ